MGEWIGFSIMLLFSIGCYVLSGFFLHGKGACLIAGYNTMSKKEQEQYDKDKLCRSTGYGMVRSCHRIFFSLFLCPGRIQL